MDSSLYYDRKKTKDISRNPDCVNGLSSHTITPQEVLRTARKRHLTSLTTVIGPFIQRPGARQARRTPDADYNRPGAPPSSPAVTAGPSDDDTSIGLSEVQANKVDIPCHDSGKAITSNNFTVKSRRFNCKEATSCLGLITPDRRTSSNSTPDITVHRTRHSAISQPVHRRG